MSIEKLTMQELNSAKQKVEVERKLPSSNKEIKFLAETYMVEARRIANKSTYCR